MGLLTIDEARSRVLEAVGVAGAVETVAIHDALGRVLAEDVVAAGNVPPFDNSAMDGFLVAAGPAGRRLMVVGESRAGRPAERAPGPGEAVRVSTGALVPPGTDAVVPIEEVEEHQGAGDGARITTTAAVELDQHIRRAGEDVARGTTVLTSGTRIGPAELGVIATSGRGAVEVRARPRVAVLATGDELVPPGQRLEPGQIHDSNALTLSALAQQAGARVVARRHVDDTPEATRDALDRALASADVVVVSGGVSVGPHDHVKPALDALGVEERFWRVALRPGKPTWFGTRGDTLVFGLPGNPVSAMVTFLLFARPALAKLQGEDPAQTRVRARLTEPIPRQTNRDEAVRVRLTEDEQGRLATPTGPQGSHQLTSMLNADGLAIVTSGEGTAAAGDVVPVELLR